MAIQGIVCRSVDGSRSVRLVAHKILDEPGSQSDGYADKYALARSVGLKLSPREEDNSPADHFSAFLRSGGPTRGFFQQLARSPIRAYARSYLFLCIYLSCTYGVERTWRTFDFFGRRTILRHRGEFS